MSAILGLFLLLSCIGRQTSGENSDQNFSGFCEPKRCSKNGPSIRFPFRLKNQPAYCGREGFKLSCLNDKIILHLPHSGDYYVQEISYLDSFIYIVSIQETTCPLQSLVSLNLTNSTFEIPQFKGFTMVNCTERVIWSSNYESVVGPIDCMSYDKNYVYLIDASASMANLPPCRTFETSYFMDFDLVKRVEGYLRTRQIRLNWGAIDGCYDCEKSKKFCWFNSTSNATACYAPTRQHSRAPIVIGTSVGGTIIVALVIIILYKVTKSDREKENKLKIEKFLETYKAQSPTRYTFGELKKITKGFKHKLGQGGYGSVYRGNLRNGVPVAVKMLVNPKGNGQEFVNEVATMGRIHHFNVIRLLGFCSEATRNALVYEFMPNASLEKFIFQGERKSSHRPLSWEKLQKIAIGIARGIEYLHQGCNQRILHFDIKPHNILLDHNFHPKISDFGLAKLCSKDQSTVSMTAARGTAGYMAPELFSRNFGQVSYKADVFSYGMLLFEMVGCRKNIDMSVEKQSQIYFPEWIYNRMSQGRELGLQVEVDRDAEIAKKLAVVAFWCIQWNPTARPSMKMVIQMLEADLQSLEIPPTPFVSAEETETDTS